MQGFTDHYFATFDSNRQGLSNLYAEDSLLTVNGEKFKGVQQIMEKVAQLPNMQRADITVDSQPVPSQNSVLVLVSGKVMVQGESNALNFCQTFTLSPTSAGSYYVSNEVFRTLA